MERIIVIILYYYDNYDLNAIIAFENYLERSFVRYTYDKFTMNILYI